MPNASVSRVRAAAHSDEGTLERLLEDARAFSAEFPLFLANHQPMMLVALDRLGASPERLEEWFAIYRDVSRLVPQPPSVAKIGRADWRSLSRRPQPRARLSRLLHRRGRASRHRPGSRRLPADAHARHCRKRSPLLHAAQLRRDAERSRGGRRGARLLVGGLSRALPGDRGGAGHRRSGRSAHSA